MTWPRVLLWRLLGRGRTPAELAEEMSAHMALLVREYRDRGMTDEAARAEARRQFAGVTQVQEVYRSQRRLPFLDTLAQDVRYGLRQLRASPGFTAAAILTLAFGIGANLAICQLLYAVLFRSLPVREPARLVRVRLFEGRDPQRVSFPLYREMAAHQQVFESMTAVSSVGLATHEGPRGVLVSGSYFRTLGVTAQLGRVFSEENDRPGAGEVAVISHSLWQRRFSGQPSALGATLELEGARVTVIGVAPASFSGETVGAAPDFWAPMGLQPLVMPNDRLNGAAYNWLEMIGRLRPGVTPQRAQAELGPLFRAFSHLTATRFGKQYSVGVAPAARGLGDLDRRFGHPLWLLFGMAALVLAMLCANLANLLLGRGSARAHEIAVRLALGAGRWRIVRQLLTESVLLSALGVALALPLASRGAALLTAMAAPGTHLDVAADWRQIAFAAGVGLFCTCLFGFAPALAATRAGVQATLQATGRTTAGSRRRRFAASLVVLQMALSLVLVAGAALFARSLWNLRHQDLGMNRDVLLVDIPVELTPRAVARQTAQAPAMAERFRALPGARSVAVSSFGPMSSLLRTGVLSTPDRPAQRSDQTHLVHVSPQFFETMGIPIVAGRGITDDDRTGTLPAAVLNRTAARALFGGNAIGRLIAIKDHFEADKALQVVGVVADVRFYASREPEGFVVYVPLAQDPQPVTGIVLRPERSLGEAANAARLAVKSVDASLKVGAIGTYGDRFDAGLGNDKLLAVIAAAFGLLALVLSYVGVYGVLSYAVERRTQEIGIRVALGAGRAAIYRMVFREAGLLSAAGLVLGAIGSAVVTDSLRGTLFGLAPADYTASVIAAALLCAAAVFATHFPARRAAGLNPIVALREG